MKANQLLLAAILASAIGAPIETLAADKKRGAAEDARSGSITH